MPKIQKRQGSGSLRKSRHLIFVSPFLWATCVRLSMLNCLGFPPPMIPTKSANKIKKTMYSLSGTVVLTVPISTYVKPKPRVTQPRVKIQLVSHPRVYITNHVSFTWEKINHVFVFPFRERRFRPGGNRDVRRSRKTFPSVRVLPFDRPRWTSRCWTEWAQTEDHRYRYRPV